MEATRRGWAGATFSRQLGGLLVFAFAIRIVYALTLAPGLTFLDDDTFYHLTANLMADGKGYISPLPHLLRGVSSPTAEHGPLYPFLLSLIARLGGRSVDAQRMLNVTAGTLTVLAVTLIGRRLAGDRAGLICGLLCAVYPSFVGADGTLMSETLTGALVAFSLLVAVRLYQRSSVRGAAALGALVALAALTRGETLLLWPLLVIPLIARAPGRRLAVTGAAVAACLVVLAPWVARNLHVYHRVVLANDLGTTLVGANCDQIYYGKDLAGFSVPCVNAALRVLPANENEAVRSAHLRRRGLSYASHHFGRAVVVGAARLAAVWGFYHPGDQASVTGRRGFVQKTGIAMYYLLLLAALLGVRELRRRRAPLVVLAAPFIATSVAAITTWGLVRLRQEAEVSLLVLAGIGLATALSHLPARTPATPAPMPVSTAKPTGRRASRLEGE